MHRVKVTAAILAFGFLLPPSQAEAQDVRIYCNSPAQLYCVTFLDYVVQFFGEPATGVTARWDSNVELFGAGYAGFTGAFSATTRPRFVGTDCSIGLVGSFAVDGPGKYEIGDFSGGCFAEPIPSTLDDLTVIVFAGAATGPCAANGSPGGGVAECFRVPEPSTWVLMAGGLFGLGLLVWRRREERADEV